MGASVGEAGMSAGRQSGSKNSGGKKSSAKKADVSPKNDDRPVRPVDADVRLLNVEVDVQPASIFEKNDSKILEVATTNSYTVAYREGSPVNEFVIYDESGKIVETDEQIPGFQLLARDVHRYLSQMNIHHLTRRSGAYNTTPSNFTSRLSLDNDTKEDIQRFLLDKIGRTSGLNSRDLAKSTDVAAAPAAAIFSDASKTRVVFQRGKQLYVYFTTDKDGNVLNPSQWQRLVIEDNSTISDSLLKEHPFLVEFVETQKGRPIAEQTRLVSNERGILNVIDRSKNQRVYSAACAGYAIDPLDNDTIFYLTPDGDEIKVFQSSEASLTQTKVESKPLEIQGAVKNLAFDPQGNFLLVQVKDGDACRIEIRERESLAHVTTIDDVAGEFDVDNLGNVYFVDSRSRLRVAQTNFMTFPRGGLEAVKEERRKELQALADKVKDLDFASFSYAPDESEEVRLIAKAQAELEKQFGSKVAKAKSLPEVTALIGQLVAMQESEQFENYPEIFEPLAEKLRVRLQGLQVEEICSGLDRLEQLIEAADAAPQILELERLHGEVIRQRGGILISDRELRGEIDARIRSLAEAKARKTEGLRGEVSKALEEKFTAIESLVASCSTIAELRAVVGSAEVIEFDSMRFMLDDKKESREWKTQYLSLVATREAALEQELTEHQETALLKAAEMLEEARAIFLDIEHALSQEVTSSAELNRWITGNPLITGFRAKLLLLPEDVRKSEEKKLEELIRVQRASLESSGEIEKRVKRGRVSFSKRDFPVYNPTAQEVRAGRAVPKSNAMWVISDYTNELLDKFSWYSTVQLKRQSGILILEGEAGSGKNKLVDIFGNATNREVYVLPGNARMEREDLTYDHGFDPARGTFRLDSEFLKALQTPGMIIVIDEINTLPPGLVKMLNSLLDYRRTLFLPDGRSIRADESVIIVGTMNPQNYLGVKRLSQEVISRSRVMYVDYPPEKTGGKYTSYEAEILSKHVDCFQGLKSAEFRKLWDYVVNGDKTNGGDKYTSKERREALKGLAMIVRCANRVREAYKAFHENRSSDLIEFVFSTREAIDIAYELNHTTDVKTAILEVILPKVPDPEERARIRAIVENV